MIKKSLKNLFCRLSPSLYSKYLFQKMLNQRLDLANPIGLNAKIMWLKLNTYRDNPLIIKCSDKYAVREYVMACGCSEILNELYGVWDNTADIIWKDLPSSFVLKCNHGCGYNYICQDKASADTNKVLKKLDHWMKEDYWLVFAELQYRDIPKRIICEKYLGSSLTDYKFYCFNGKPKYVLTCVGRKDGHQSHIPGIEDPKFYFFDRQWKMCPLNKDSIDHYLSNDIEPPECLDQMWDVAEKLCKPFPFVRVDLYDYEGNVVFGELTFTPSAGLDTGRLQATDRMFGNLLILE